MKIFNLIKYPNLFRVATAIFIIFITSCSNKDIINKNDMAKIVSELYLADQYVEQNYQLKDQTDSLKLYPAIINKYGYTMEKYETSTKYYLAKKDTYKEIYDKALQILKKKEEELLTRQDNMNKLLSFKNRVNNWWMLDSAQTMADSTIANNIFLFLLKSINNVNVLDTLKDTNFRVTDTSYLHFKEKLTIWNRIKFMDKNKFSLHIKRNYLPYMPAPRISFDSIPNKSKSNELKNL